ncbi:MAG TPA: NAD(P)-dependent oxidoreductase [Propionibacterium sp.]|nr:NAD(P)-dependent oxidoreductase [Propionibacterium sp.]
MNTSTIVVTGANGFVGSHTCAALNERGARVRAVVRRGGTAPQLPNVEEWAGDFHDPAFADELCAGADAVINTVHPMRDASLEDQAAHWAETLARAAHHNGVPLFVQVSTTSVYRREADSGDVGEDSPLVDDTARPYATTKRDADLALSGVEGITRVLIRPTAILGPGESSIWNTLRPAALRDEASARVEDPDRTFGWVHVSDLAELIADIATGAIPRADDPDEGPVPGAATAVNAVSGNQTWRDYLGPVCEALGVSPEWETRPAFRAELRAERARAWGWQPKVSFDEAMRELLSGLG